MRQVECAGTAVAGDAAAVEPLLEPAGLGQLQADTRHRVRTAEVRVVDAAPAGAHRLVVDRQQHGQLQAALVRTLQPPVVRLLVGHAVPARPAEEVRVRAVAEAGGIPFDAAVGQRAEGREVLTVSRADQVVEVAVAVNERLLAERVDRQLVAVYAGDHVAVEQPVLRARREVVGAQRLADSTGRVKGVAPDGQAAKGQVGEHVQVQVGEPVDGRARRIRCPGRGVAIAIRLRDGPVGDADPAVGMEAESAGRRRRGDVADRLTSAAAAGAEAEGVLGQAVAAFVRNGYADAGVRAFRATENAGAVRTEAERVRAAAELALAAPAGDLGQAARAGVLGVVTAAAARRDRVRVPAGLGDAAGALAGPAAGADRFAMAARAEAEERRHPGAAARAVAGAAVHLGVAGLASAAAEPFGAGETAASLAIAATVGRCSGQRCRHRQPEQPDRCCQPRLARDPIGRNSILGRLVHGRALFRVACGRRALRGACAEEDDLLWDVRGGYPTTCDPSNERAVRCRGGDQFAFASPSGFMPGERHASTWYVACVAPTLRRPCGSVPVRKMTDPGPAGCHSFR